MTIDDHLQVARDAAAPTATDTAGRAGAARQGLLRLLAPIHNRQQQAFEALAAAVAELAAEQTELARRLDSMAADLDRVIARSESDAAVLDAMSAEIERLAGLVTQRAAVVEARLEALESPDQ
jgi:ABC-type phosphate transport system auxiliary subunit